MTSASTAGHVAIRAARPADAALVFALVREFAAFENLPVEATRDGLAKALFEPGARVFCEIAEWTEAGMAQAAGCAIWYYTFSTFRGCRGIFLEDLYVRPAFRRSGIGTALLSHLARRCATEGLLRLEWRVLAWNDNAIRFYQRHGAQFLDEWRTCRVDEAELQDLAKL